MIYVTHDQIEAMTMADKIVVLRDGVIEQVGSPMDLYHNPKTKFVAGFIGQPNMNFLRTTDTEIKKNKLFVSIGDLNLELAVDVSKTNAGDEIDIGIRPEDLGVSSSGGIPMSVDVVEHIGATVILYGSVLGDSNFCAVLPSDSVIKPGETVSLVFDSSKCHAFNSVGQALKKTHKKK
jgi:multiple sugar transport system ATP-binding protein